MLVAGSQGEEGGVHAGNSLAAVVAASRPGRKRPLEGHVLPDGLSGRQGQDDTPRERTWGQVEVEERERGAVLALRQLASSHPAADATCAEASGSTHKDAVHGRDGLHATGGAAGGGRREGGEEASWRQRMRPGGSSFRCALAPPPTTAFSRPPGAGPAPLSIAESSGVGGRRGAPSLAGATAPAAEMPASLQPPLPPSSPPPPPPPLVAERSGAGQSGGIRDPRGGSSGAGGGRGGEQETGGGSGCCAGSDASGGADARQEGGGRRSGGQDPVHEAGSDGETRAAPGAAATVLPGSQTSVLRGTILPTPLRAPGEEAQRGGRVESVSVRRSLAPPPR